MSAKIVNLQQQLLSDNWYILKKYTFDLHKNSGEVMQQVREVYDRGNGATVLLYNREKGSVVLTRQFRLPTYLNGNSSGLLIETCAGLLDGDNPEDGVRREAMEETGYQLSNLEKLFSPYMSPGSVTEIVHCFIAEYHDDANNSAGGGVDDEDIEVLELPFHDAMTMINDGRIQDGKTIMLLQALCLRGIMPVTAR